ncbi:SUKH-3 domain-containing protein [Kitasatospora sp. GAS1066B]|uniref:SUKH-3 domain-containing protein n=1 Tax=Kitasatospora sp. GAS1066B TaxID=3156271 RepID=UPI003513481B
MSDRHHTELPGVLRTALADGGWTTWYDPASTARRWLIETMATPGPSATGAWQLFPAAQQLIRKYAALTLRPVGPGVDVVARGCVIDPREGQYARAAYTLLSSLVGAAVFPVGSADGSLLGVDAHGRLYIQDPGGWWFLGADPLAGLARLVEGFAPSRVTPDGRWLALPALPRVVERLSWRAPEEAEPDPVATVVRIALVTAYELWRCRLTAPRVLRLFALGAGSEPLLDREYPLGTESLDDLAATIAAAELPQQAGRHRLHARLSGSGAWDCLVTRQANGELEVLLRHRGAPDAAAAGTVQAAAFAAAIDRYALALGRRTR